MKSKLHIRCQDDRPGYTTEVELEVTDQEVSGINVITKGRYSTETHFPHIGWSVKSDLVSWCSARTRNNEVKLPDEPASAYRHIDNIGQLGDMLGLGRVD